MPGHLIPQHEEAFTPDVLQLAALEAMIAAAILLLWVLAGLLIWLELYGEYKPRHRFAAFFVTLFCGPAAWVVSAWTIAHIKRVVTPVTVAAKEPWTMPNSDRWNN
jgi:hypothetical protein